MKIALCQINPTVGSFSYNRDKIIEYYKNAINQGADLVIFPELITMGYPPQDLLLEKGFVESNIIVIEEISKHFTVPAIVGYVRKNGKKLYNAAAVIKNGKIIYNYDKLLLPTYDVFDEDRYFSEGRSIGIFDLVAGNGKITLGIQICEDLWDGNYDKNVTGMLVQAGAEMIINISASPYHENRLVERSELIINKVQMSGIPFIYCNLVGAQDELVFDGQSLVYDGQARLLAQGKSFEEELILFDYPLQKEPIELVTQSREEEIYDALVLGVREYFRKTGHKDALLGMSGGIDSSLVACIAADALGGDRVHGYALPSIFSTDHSVRDAEELAKNLDINFEIIPIKEIVSSVEATLEKTFSGTERNVAEENIQARARGNLLMAIANKFGWLLLVTGNKTELALGYCTLYGDMSGGLSVIADLSKTDVYALSRFVNERTGYARIPVSSIEKVPSAELAPDQFDPFDYDLVSPLVDKMIEDLVSPEDLVKEGNDPEIVYDLYNRIHKNEYKRRQAAFGIRVSLKAFGVGRRIPIINHFSGKLHKRGKD